MRFLNDKHRAAVMASIRGGFSRAKRLLGATPGDRRQLAKRLLLGGAVTGAAAGTFLLAKRRGAPDWVKMMAARTGIAGAGGTLASAFTTLRENAEAARKKVHETAIGARDSAGRQLGALREMGARNIRTIPVEALIAKGVDKGFGAAEGLIHRTAAAHLGKIEEVAASKLGGLQLAVSGELAHRGRRLHRGLGFPQPTARDAQTLSDWHTTLGTPNFAELARGRKLRNEYLLKRADTGARELWKKLSRNGELQRLMMFGEISPKTVSEYAKDRDVGADELRVTLLRLKQMSSVAGGF